MRSTERIKLLALAGVLWSLLAMAGCDRQSAKPLPQGMPEVGVVAVAPAPVALTTELSGRVTPHLLAEVRPQVGGIIQKRLFEEGAEVKAGQPLYQIDSATYQAAFDSARAALAKAEGNLVPARLKQERFRELVAVKAVSQQEYDDASAMRKQVEAEVAVAKAAVETARINLAYTAITAPISGRIGRSAVTAGALVTANQATALAVIQQLDPVYVDVSQSSAELLRLKRDLALGTIRREGGNQARVQLLLEDGSPYPLEGTMKFSEVTVEPGTGSITLRALFPNPNHLLLPGMFVRAVVREGVNEQAILVPQRGVTRNPKGEAMVMVVGAEDKAEQRIITVARTVGENWLVTAGVNPGDRVILEGVQKARPGTPVKAVPFGSKPEAASQPQSGNR
ncbi:MAG: efflux RND transporter periplasmic adaptor subunit [Thermodesulfobacteriota bacterium]